MCSSGRVPMGTRPFFWSEPNFDEEIMLFRRPKLFSANHQQPQQAWCVLNQASEISLISADVVQLVGGRTGADPGH